MESKQALVIESRKLSQMLKEVFELLWERTEGEFKKPKHISL